MASNLLLKSSSLGSLDHIRVTSGRHSALPICALSSSHSIRMTWRKYRYRPSTTVKSQRFHGVIVCMVTQSRVTVPLSIVKEPLICHVTENHFLPTYLGHRGWYYDRDLVTDIGKAPRSFLKKRPRQLQGSFFEHLSSQLATVLPSISRLFPPISCSPEESKPESLSDSL